MKKLIKACAEHRERKVKLLTQQLEWNCINAFTEKQAYIGERCQHQPPDGDVCGKPAQTVFSVTI